MLTNDELKKKIVEVISQKQTYGITEEFKTEDLGHGGWQAWTETTKVNNAEIADALIAAGIGDVRKFANTLTSKIPCHSYYYGDSIVSAIYVLKEGREIKDVKPVNISEFLVDELRRKLKEAEHRAEIAERALNDCVEYYSWSGLCPVLDCNYNKACWQKNVLRI